MRFENLSFENTPNFTPYGTPYELLSAGIFCGGYFGVREELAIHMTEFPEFIPLVGKKILQYDARWNREVNLFGEASSLSRQAWITAGAIDKRDPLGWFQWYCRFVQGRRIDEYDARQIARWASFGARHGAQITLNSPGDYSKRRRQRQALLQWAHDPWI